MCWWMARNEVVMQNAKKHHVQFGTSSAERSTRRHIITSMLRDIQTSTEIFRYSINHPGARLLRCCHCFVVRRTMVRLLCLEDEDASDPAEAKQPGVAVVEDDGRPNPNINGFSAALSCYP